MSTEPRVAVGAVVFDHHGRVLLVRRSHPPAQSTWTLPGGKVHFGELLEQAVAREILEETSLRVQPIRLVDVVQILSEGFHYVVHDYLCALISDPSGACPADDAADLVWVSPPELPRFNVTDAVLSVVLKAVALSSLAAH